MRCSLLVALLFVSSAQTVRFGLSQTLTSSDPAQSNRVELGQRIADGVGFWHQTLGAQEGFDYLILDDRGNTSLLVANYQQLLADPSVDFLLGPQGSDFSMLVKPSVTQAGRLLIGTSVGADAFNQGTSLAMTVLTAARRALFPAFPLLRSKNARSVAYLTENHPFPLGACSSLPALASQYRLTLKGGVNLTFYAAGNLTGLQKLEIRRAVRALKSLNAEVLVLGTFPPSGFHALQVLKDLDYLPKAVIVAPMLQDWEANPLADYLLGVEEWLPKVAYPADPWYGDSQQYAHEFEDLYGYVPSSYNVMGSVSALMLQLAVTRATNNTQHAVAASFRSLDLDLFWGPMSYSADGSSLKDTVVFQMINSTRIPVAPSATKLRDIVYPMPEWDERRVPRESCCCKH